MKSREAISPREKLVLTAQDKQSRMAPKILLFLVIPSCPLDGEVSSFRSLHDANNGIGTYLSYYFTDPATPEYLHVFAVE